MENLTCKGLSAAHRRMLIKCITEEIGSIPEPVEIEFMEPIRRKQYSSLWYGGQIAAIRVHGCVFEVHALGDVYAWLYDKSDRDRELLYVKDKNNSGNPHDCTHLFSWKHVNKGNLHQRHCNPNCNSLQNPTC